MTSRSAYSNGGSANCSSDLPVLGRGSIRVRARAPAYPDDSLRVPHAPCMTLHVDRRLRVVPPELVALARAAVERVGLKEAAREIGISRATLTGVLAGTGSMAGTIAILAGYAQGREHAA